MLAYLKLPPGVVLMAVTPNEIAKLLEALDGCAVVAEAEGDGAFSQMPEKERDPVEYLSFLRRGEPRVEALKKECAVKAAAQMARELEKLESFISGGPVPVSDGPGARILEHRHKDDPGA